MCPRAARLSTNHIGLGICVVAGLFAVRAAAAPAPGEGPPPPEAQTAAPERATEPAPEEPASAPPANAPPASEEPAHATAPKVNEAVDAPAPPTAEGSSESPTSNLDAATTATPPGPRTMPSTVDSPASLPSPAVPGPTLGQTDEPPRATPPGSPSAHDAWADDALAQCLDSGRNGAALAVCLRDVIEDHPDTPAARSAQTALRVMSVATAGPEPSGGLLPSFLKPGYLELATLGGVYGIWAGVTGGVLATSNADQYQLHLEPWAIILGTGMVSVAGGLGSAALGYVLADAVKIDRGYAWSTSAGMTWGLSYAISMIPAAYDLVDVPWYVQDELNFAVPLIGGGTGAVVGFGLAHLLRPDIAEVSMMNTGGWIGGAYGLILGINMSTWGPANTKVGLLNATTYSLGKTTGLLAGAAASQVLKYTWGETLLGDFGSVLGVILFGATSAAFLISPVAEPMLYAIVGKDDPELFGKLATTTVSVAVGAGMAAGLGSTTAGLVLWHHFTGAPVLRDDALGFRVAPLVSLAPSRDGREATPVYGMVATW